MAVDVNDYFVKTSPEQIRVPRVNCTWVNGLGEKNSRPIYSYALYRLRLENRKRLVAERRGYILIRAKIRKKAFFFLSTTRTG